MDLEQLVVGVIVAGAVFFLARKMRNKGTCGCGCGNKKSAGQKSNTPCGGCNPPQKDIL